MAWWAIFQPKARAERLRVIEAELTWEVNMMMWPPGDVDIAISSENSCVLVCLMQFRSTAQLIRSYNK